jgi:hypothetical protein
MVCLVSCNASLARIVDGAQIARAMMEVGVRSATVEALMAKTTKWYWPDVSTRRDASFAIEEAFWAAAFVAVLGSLLTAVFIFGDGAPVVNAWGFADAAIFAGIAFGIRRKSRLSAVLGLVLYVSNVIYGFIVFGPKSPLIPALVSLAFVHGVRGTFAYHEFPALAANLPSVEQRFQALRNMPRQETPEPKN